MSRDNHTPRNWSVNTILTIGWLLIGLVVFVCIALMIVVMYLSDEHKWPLYFSIPAAFVVPVGLMILLFMGTAKVWVPWSYANVDDVRALQKASQISGFGAYPIGEEQDRKVTSEQHKAIAQRFAEYQFVDDVKIPAQYRIYFKKWYQGFYSILFLLLGTFCFLSAFAVGSIDKAGGNLVVGLVFFAFVFVRYYKTSDRSPQIILSDDGIEVQCRFISWGALTGYEILQGETSDLKYKVDDEWLSIEITDFSVGNRGLNHLLHVYSNRYKANHKKSIVSAR